MCIIMISRDGLDPSVARKARVYIDSYVDEILDDIARVNGTPRQRGHGMGDFFVANRQPAYQPQKGGGFGKFLGSLFRSVRPMFMPTLKTLGKHALSTSIAVVGDVARGHDWREAAKRRFSETGEEIVGEVQNKVQKLMTGSGECIIISIINLKKGPTLQIMSMLQISWRAEMLQAMRGNHQTKN